MDYQTELKLPKIQVVNCCFRVREFKAKNYAYAIINIYVKTDYIGCNYNKTRNLLAGILTYFTHVNQTYQA